MGCQSGGRVPQVGKGSLSGIIGEVSFELRMARESDIAAIGECYLRSWRSAYDGYLPPDVVAGEAEKRRGFAWARGIEADASAVFVAIDDKDSVLGVVQADEELPPPRDRPEITMLYVEPAAWGTDVARALLEAGLRWIAERGHHDARLRVVEAHGRARRFYEREGWRVDPDLEPAQNDFFRLIYYYRLVDH